MDEEDRSVASGYTGGDSVADVLAWAGVEVVFGIPSVHNLPIYDALARRDTIRVITVRHEQSAAAAADGYARSTGRLGVFLTSTGPGAANAMGGLLEAYVSGSPLLHLTGQIESALLGTGRGFIHEVPDQPAMLKSLSKGVLRAERSDEVGETVAAAARLAMTAPFGPVSVELPIDLQYAAARRVPLIDGPSPTLERPGRPEAVPAVWDRAIEMLLRARRPVIWVGGGVVWSSAETEVGALAERLGAGVLTSPNGRGVLPEEHPLVIGNLPWDRGVRDLVERADILVGIGTRYQGPNTENWKMRLPDEIVQIDLDPSRPGRNYPAAIALEGDAKAVLSYLLEALDDAPGSEDGWREAVAATAAEARGRLRETIGPQAALLDELAALLDPDTVVVKDSTIPAYTWGNRILPVRKSRTAIMPNGFAIGLGAAHALGAAAGSHGAPVVAMVGDGGFMLTAAELATMARESLAVVVIVFNDGGYGILRNIQDKQYDRRLGVDLGRVDFCALARALGVEAERVGSSEEFGRAVKVGLGSGGPYLVEVDLDRIGPMRTPYTGTSRPPQS